MGKWISDEEMYRIQEMYWIADEKTRHCLVFLFSKRYNTKQCNAVQVATAQYSEVHYNTVHHNPIPLK